MPRSSCIPRVMLAMVIVGGLAVGIGLTAQANSEGGAPLSVKAERDDTIFWAEARVEWGSYATPANATLLYEDVTCDGIHDYIGGYLNLDIPDGVAYMLLVVSGDTSAPAQASAYFGYDDSAYGLTKGGDDVTPPALTIEPWEVADVTANLKEEACHKAIRIDDGMSDAVRVFWRMTVPEGQERLSLFRN